MTSNQLKIILWLVGGYLVGKIVVILVVAWNNG